MNKLNGLRVLNTRPIEQNQALSQLITSAGGISIEVPGLALGPTSDKWLKAMPPLSTIDQAIFISANAVQYYFEKLKALAITWSSSIQVTAIGNATASALVSQSIRVDHIPAIADSEHVLKLPTFASVQDQSILLIKGNGGLRTIQTNLKMRGAHLTALSVYRRQLPKISPQYLNSLWRDDGVDIILITSQAALRNLFTLFGKEAHSWLCHKPCIVISDRLAKIAKCSGMRTIIVRRYDDILDLGISKALTNNED